MPRAPTLLPLGCSEGTYGAGIQRRRPEHPPFTSLGLLHRAPAPGQVPPWRPRGESRGNAVPTPPPGVTPDGRVRKMRRLSAVFAAVVSTHGRTAYIQYCSLYCGQQLLRECMAGRWLHQRIVCSGGDSRGSCDGGYDSSDCKRIRSRGLSRFHWGKLVMIVHDQSTRLVTISLGTIGSDCNGCN